MAEKDLKKLDWEIHRLVLDYPYKKLEADQNPRRFGKPLSGRLKNMWSYRVKEYRIICEVHDHKLQILAIHIDHRKKVNDLQEPPAASLEALSEEPANML